MKPVAIKVLLVGPVPPPFGGIPIYVENLYRAQIDNVEFVLFNTSFPEWVAPFHREGKRSYSSIFEIGFQVGIKKIIYVFWSFALLAWTIISVHPQIVQVFTCSYWGYWRNWIYILIARFLERKSIFHLLGAIDVFYNEVGNFQKALLRKSLNSADCYLLQSPELELWAQKYSKKTVVGLWNGINLKQIPPKSDKPPDWIASFSGPVGITIGNLSHNKGSAEIIYALARLKENGLVVGWVFVGRGDLHYFKNLAELKGVSEQVYFTGEIMENEKWQFLHYADFFCLPSYAEGQPISIIEAMACKLPIISTYVGSIPEMIQNDVTGKLILPGDVVGLEEAISQFANNPELSQAMGMRSWRFCYERHDIQGLYNALSDLYSRLID